MKILIHSLALIFIISFAWAESRNTSKLDSNQPIDITADNLEVDQEKNIATFIGQVVAIQGEVKISSDKMIVFYQSGTEKNYKTSSPKSETSDTLGQQIKKIENYGHVKMVNKDSESYAENSVYDVKSELLTLHTQVKLIKNNNILYGDRLIYNMATGKSKLFSDPKSHSSGKKRVKAIIVPKSKSKPKKDK